ncbi:MAG: FG-GAP-like repeat-containing protein, partial [Sediminibacterium sp.]
KIKLNGASPNTLGYGTRVSVFAGNSEQVLEQMPTRGFQSSVDPVLVIGLDTVSVIDSIKVRWPDQKVQVIKRVVADTLLTIDQKNAVAEKKINDAASTLFENITATALIGSSRHKENAFVDFDVERLIPKLISTEGPCVAIADVNGDGLEDFFIGAAAGDTAKLFLQQKDGRFVNTTQNIFIADSYYESTGAAFFDADGDGDADLVVASGGNEAKPGSPYLFARLYINNGKGQFSSSAKGWPSVSINASCISIGDYDADGKPDIFIGARDIPGSYGISPSSVLLHNEGGGVFKEVTTSVAPELQKVGMVTAAQWADIDGDGKKELIVVGDWMPVTVFKYASEKLKRNAEIPHSSGWWNCLTVGDIDGNGTLDIIAGNFGLNSNIKADAQHPARLFVDDFDKNGQTECIPVYYKPDGKAYPYYLKDEMESQLPVLKKKFLKYESYAGKSIEDILSKEQYEHAIKLSVEQTQTSIFINDGKGNFSMQPLPVAAQLAPVFGIVLTDLNGDTRKDLFMAGNFYGLKPQTGRLDASYGVTLLNNGKNQFTDLRPSKSGLFVKGEARGVGLVKAVSGDYYILVGMNNDKPYLFKHIQKN